MGVKSFQDRAERWLTDSSVVHKGGSGGICESQEFSEKNL